MERCWRRAGLPAARAAALVDATTTLVKSAASAFLPSATTPHYSFTPRDVAAVVAGLRAAPPALLRDPLTAARLWAHECDRELRDRLVSASGGAKFDDLLVASAAKHLPDVDRGALRAAPRVFSSLLPPADGEADDGPVLAPVPSMNALRDAIIARAGGDGGLVLHPDAAAAVAGVARVLTSPGGHALLVGVGGLGKHSVVRLAAAAVGVDVAPPPAGAGGAVADFRAHLASLFTRAGARDAPVCLLLVDDTLRDPACLMCVNELLVTGCVAGLGTSDERDVWVASARSDARAAGLPDTPASCWEVFKGRVSGCVFVWE